MLVFLLLSTQNVFHGFVLFFVAEVSNGINVDANMRIRVRKLSSRRIVTPLIRTVLIPLPWIILRVNH